MWCWSHGKGLDDQDSGHADPNQHCPPAKTSPEGTNLIGDDTVTKVPDMQPRPEFKRVWETPEILYNYSMVA